MTRPTTAGEADRCVPFSDMTDNQAVKWSLQVVESVRSDSAHLDQPITPFATARKLMGGPPPSRWRFIARRAWFANLYERTHREMHRQRLFARSITLATGAPR